jgi:VWFA-related protein
MRIRAVLFVSLAFHLAIAAMACFSAGPLVAQSDTTRSQEQSPNQNAHPEQASPQTQQVPQSNGAAERTTPPTLTIRSTVRRVIVDVMVRDAHGQPVHGLTAGNFSVTEDKQPQRVVSFDVYDFDKTSISRGPNAPPLPPNVFVNIPTIPERGPLYVMLYDLVNTEMEDQMTARGKILKFISGKPAGTRFAVFVNSDELYLAQGFTADKDQLYAALDPKRAKSHVPKIFLMGRNYGYGNPYTAIDVLTHIGQYLDGVPGRKNLIWVAGTFPTAIYAQEGNPVDAGDQVRAEMNALAQAEVAVFPVNVRGVVVNPEGALTGAAPNGGVGGAAAGTQLGAGAPAVTTTTGPISGSPVASTMGIALTVGSQGGASLAGDYTAQEAMATATGGRAFYSDNDLASALEQATEEGANYYTLAYSPPSQEDDGRCHNISVKLDKAGYQMSYRRSYCRVPLVSSALEDSGGKSGAGTFVVPLEAGDVLQANMKLGAPMVHDLIFSAHVHTEGGVALATPVQMAQLEEEAAFFRTHRRNKLEKPLPPVKIQSYSIDYRVLDPQLKAQAMRNDTQPALEFAVAAFDDDGKVLNGTVSDGVAETSTSPGDNKAGLYRVHQLLAVPVKAVSIRVGVRDRMSDRMGTLEVRLPLAPEPVAKALPPTH